MVYDDENENNCAEATGHDVQEGQAEDGGLAFPGHYLCITDDHQIQAV